MRIDACLVLLLAMNGVLCENVKNNTMHPSKTGQLISITPVSTTTSAIRKNLLAIANRKFQDNDANLLELMRKEIGEATRINRDNPKLFIHTVNKKAQDFVSNVTASYTQAIFSSKSPSEAKKILSRFRNTIRDIIELTQSKASTL